MVSTVDVSGTTCVKFSPWDYRASQWFWSLFDSDETDTSVRRMPKSNILKEIRHALESARGKKDRTTVRTGVDGQIQAMMLSFTIRGISLRVANILWPIHVQADREMVTFVLNELKSDFNNKDVDANAVPQDSGDPDPDQPDQGVVEAVVAGSDDDDAVDVDTWSLDSLATSGLVDRTDDDVRDGADKLPDGVYWASAKKSFIGKRAGSKTREFFRVRSRLCKNQSDAKVELVWQIVRATTYVTTGTVLANESQDAHDAC